MLAWTLITVILIVLVFGYIAYYFRTQPQRRPMQGEEPDRENLTVMARDPHWLFAYWDIAAERWEEALEEYPGGRKVLRVYQLSDQRQFDPSHTAFTDVEITPDADSWHIKHLQAGESYVLELGVRLDDGHFIAVLRSRRVTTPHAGPSEIDPDWQPVESVWTSSYQGDDLGGSSEIYASK